MLRTMTTIAVLALATAAGAQFKAQPAASSTPPPAAATATTAPVADPLKAARRITIQEAQKLVAANKAVYVDVRGTDNYNTGHIKGALNISGSELSKRLKEIPRGKMIITYCA